MVYACTNSREMIPGDSRLSVEPCIRFGQANASSPTGRSGVAHAITLGVPGICHYNGGENRVHAN